MFKNTASQKVRVFAFADAGHASLDAGEPVTGDAANITARTAVDNAALAATNDVNPAEIDATNAKGYYEFDPTQAETNGDVVEWYAQSSTAGVQLVTVGGSVINTRPPNFSSLGIESDGDVTKVNTLDGHTAQTGDSFARIGANGNALTQVRLDDDSLTASKLNANALEAIRDAILDRVLSGNHDTADTPGALLQAIDDVLTDTGTTLPVTLTTIANYIDTEVAAILAIANKLDDTLEDDAGTYRFTTNALENAPAGGGGGGGGCCGNVSETYIVQIYETDGTTPVADAEVTITTDLAGTNMIAQSYTNASGNIDPAFQLDPDDYYMWVKKAGFTFTNPTPITVPAP